MKHILITSAVVFALLFPHGTKAIGFTVSPSRVVFTASGQTQNLTITNGPHDAAHIEIYPDDFEQSLAIDTPRFDLAPGAVQTVAIRFHASLKESVATTLSVTAVPLSTAVTAFHTGIKIPVTMRSSSSSLTASIGSIASKNTPLLLIILIILVALVLFRRRS